MNRFIYQKTAGLFLAAAVLVSLSSCGNPSSAPDPTVPAAPSPSATAVSAAAADHLFTVRYSADQTMNPITGTDPNNMAIAPLMYEGLFVLNSKLEAERVLCDNDDYTSDGINYTFKLKPGIAMSDGSTLTASDVRYSLTEAKKSGRFSGRLKLIDSVTAVDGLTVKITLKYANYALPELLDVPIIKLNSIDQNHPAGSGPYYFDETGGPRLVALQGYRDRVPVPVVYLKSCTDSELSVEFSSQLIDFFWDDPADASDINILSDHEIRYYNTTILEYIGFNARNSDVIANADMRRAIGLAVNRKKMISFYLNHAVAAPLVLSPNYKYYDPKWEPQDTDALDSMSAIFKSFGPTDDKGQPEGLKDTDGDGYLEWWDGGNWIPFKLRFIVNGDNRFKVEAATEIANALKEVGIDVDLQPLPWDTYLTALQDGTYEMYYGDVALPADYDLTELLSPGGSLDYGHLGSASYVSSIHDFLGAPDEASQRDAAKRMCDLLYNDAPIIPVLYRQYAVHTNRNVITGMAPSQSSLFYGFTSWKINLG